MTIVILFKNGKEIRVKCEESKIHENILTSQIEKMRFEGVTENKPIFVNPDEVIAVYRVVSDE